MAPPIPFPLLRRLVAAILAVGLGAAAAPAARAAASDWDRSDVTAVRLISAQTGVGTGEAVSLGLQMRLAPGWKVYWRTPGEAGFPPRIDWSGSRNLASAEIHWPAPTRFRELGDLVTHGYKDEVVLPITARVEEPGTALEAHALVDYVACEEVCIPFRADLSLVVPAGPAGPSVHALPIARFANRVPRAPTEDGPAIQAVERIGSGADRALRITARAIKGFDDPTVFVEGPASVDLGRPEIEARAGARSAVAYVAAPARGDGPPLVGAPVTVTLVDGDRAVEQTLTVVAGTAEAPRWGALAAMLALAFAGGLILNLMPCVLPVLSLKVMGLVSAAGAPRREVAARFLAAAAGIVVSFLALAAAAVAAKGAGMAVGWGVQFQEPLFLVALTAVITLFACNLWGLFAIPLPAWLGSLAGDAGGGRGLGGHFAHGAFATLLATPCSAPFLGTAVGFALARGPLEIVAIFAALGTGMAAPYLAVAALPDAARLLPRPGRWMTTLRRVLGVLLAATAVWLVTVLAAQSGAVAAAAVAVLMVAAAVGLWLAGRLAGGRRLAAAGAVAVAFALAFAAPGELGRPAPPARADTGTAADAWRPFDRAAIPALVAAGKTVFVDVTADWCVTCQFNKTTVLDREPVAGRLAAEQVVAMRADWTSPDPEIAAYLEEFGRFGIPFNVVYGPALPRGLALPELLTRDAVVTALDRAGSAVAQAE